MSDESSEDKFLQVHPTGWGVIGGTIWAAVAFLSPQFVIEPLVPLILALQIGDNGKQFILRAVVDMLVLAAIFAIVRLYGLHFASIGLKRSWPTLNQLGYAVLLAPAYFFVSSISIQVVARLFPAIDFTEKQQTGFINSQGAGLIVLFVALVLVPPIVEEVVFRGFLFRGYCRRFGVVVASILISLLFALVHAPIAVSIDVFVLSLFLCHLRVKTDSLWPPILLHSLKNLVAFIFLFIIHVQ